MQELRYNAYKQYHITLQDRFCLQKVHNLKYWRISTKQNLILKIYGLKMILVRLSSNLFLDKFGNQSLV
jgi:hypothetical protein